MLSGLRSRAGRRGWMTRSRMAYSEAVVIAVVMVITSMLVSVDGRTIWMALCKKSILGNRMRYCVSWVECSS